MWTYRKIADVKLDRRAVTWLPKGDPLPEEEAARIRYCSPYDRERARGEIIDRIRSRFSLDTSPRQA
jgi:hypothetical protein